MCEKKQTDSTKKEESQTRGFSCCDGNFKEIQKKMQDFFSNPKDSSYCSEMMKNMCCESTEKSEKKQRINKEDK